MKRKTWTLRAHPSPGDRAPLPPEQRRTRQLQYISAGLLTAWIAVGVATIGWKTTVFTVGAIAFIACAAFTVLILLHTLVRTFDP